MYIEVVPNRNAPPAVLLRESWRGTGKVRKRTLCNLTNWPPALVESFRALLKGGTVIPRDEAGELSLNPGPRSRCSARCRTGMWRRGLASCAPSVVLRRRV